MYQTLFLNGHELVDGLETAAGIGLLLNDTLDIRQDQETDQTSDIEEIQKPRANEVEGFGGTLLGGFTTGTEGSDADDLVSSLEGTNGKAQTATLLPHPDKDSEPAKSPGFRQLQCCNRASAFFPKHQATALEATRSNATNTISSTPFT